ncbi:exopolysaccharide biosynthesis polyprenyl glycosylphosphotransferase [Lachnospiraceae bacterium OttesenSCG-928-D06]|nr:exopolysaccharide biosynthesis polyprenyl glycosylphosphotransferase [Lachnospiraceae bacterium OttesenSCG-928-D06]
MKKLDAIVKVAASQLNLVSLLFYTIVYGITWYQFYYDMVFTGDRIVAFWQKGNWLMIGIYGIMFYVFSKVFEGNKSGFYKTMDTFLAEVWTLFCVNSLTFLQIALMAVWPVRMWSGKLWPMIIATLADFAFAGIWSAISQRIYRFVYPPRKLLLIHGSRPIEGIMEKLESRGDRYLISKSMDVKEGAERLKKEALSGYEGVVLWDIPDKTRNVLLKYFYSRSIRVYLMPKIADVLIKGSESLHLFDAPIFMVREYSLTFGQRVYKRGIDIICSLILLIITSPIMLVTAILIKMEDAGPVLYRQIRCTIGGKEFEILKFRSMRVDAEGDGVVRLAAKKDDRITKIGKVIRKVRIDELPQLINILRGEMSFIGPRPERPELIRDYMDEMPEFAFRMKVKAGLAGYAQVYGQYNTTPYDKLKLDLSYIEEYSVWLDLKLMLLTLKILLKAESTEGIEENQVNALRASLGEYEPGHEKEDDSI